MKARSKVTKAVAKATGKTADLAREFGRFIALYAHGATPTSGVLSAPNERRQRLMQRAREFSRKRGLEAPTRRVPLNVLIPVVQNAVIEEDDALQDLWAQLLVNAGDAGRPTEVRRMHVDMLEQLSSSDVRILLKLYEHADKTSSLSPGLWTYRLPDHVVIAGGGNHPRPSPDVELSVGNLIRVGCLESTMMWRGADGASCVLVTPLGRSLVEACTLGKELCRE